jgi:hypothetical protein
MVMKKVTLVFAIDIEHGKQMIGVAESIDAAITLIKTSGYGFDMTEQQFALLAILKYTTNLPTNFRLETWEVQTKVK